MGTFRGVDYFHIDSLFSEQELLVRQTVRQFVDAEVTPVIREAWREGRSRAARMIAILTRRNDRSLAHRQRQLSFEQTSHLVVGQHMETRHPKLYACLRSRVRIGLESFHE